MYFHILQMTGGQYSSSWLRSSSMCKWYLFLNIAKLKYVVTKKPQKRNKEKPSTFSGLTCFDFLLLFSYICYAIKIFHLFCVQVLVTYPLKFIREEFILKIVGWCIDFSWHFLCLLCIHHYSHHTHKISILRHIIVCISKWWQHVLPSGKLLTLSPLVFCMSNTRS